MPFKSNSMKAQSSVPHRDKLQTPSQKNLPQEIFLIFFSFFQLVAKKVDCSAIYFRKCSSCQKKPSRFGKP
ncbi:MAG: hypothetical protein DRR19_24895 [Candidatus Parabeggiatoa sp. nov. 1]|nr:MAG: hypothetical protein DRR19_24895 [Gammaproteobacteria bacterium]